MRRHFFVGLTLALLFALVAPGVSGQALGVVMMHGKWSSPPPWHLPVSNAIREAGWPVVELNMPWSGNRLYDSSYDDALESIAEAVGRLRAQGIRRVIVGGHSFGANAAIAYAGQGRDIDGVLAMAPGHMPRRSYESGTTRDSVDEARRLVAQGRGAETIAFTDTNQGRKRGLSSRADIFLGYFDPGGLGDMPSQMAKIPRPLPILWLIGTSDPLYPAGSGYAFDMAPPHPLSRYEVVSANHVNTPAAGIDVVMSWLKAIAAQP